MPITLEAGEKKFDAKFAALLTMKRETSVEVSEVVAAIIADVIADGDEALFRFTEKFDGVSFDGQSVRFLTQKSVKRSLRSMRIH